MSQILIAISLDNESPKLTFTHKLELADEVPEGLVDYYTKYYCGLMEQAVQPDNLVQEVRRKFFVQDFYRGVLNENEHQPPKDNVIPLHPPVKRIKAKG